MKSVICFLTVLSCLALGACGVEVRTPHDEDNSPDLVVDQPLYIYQGQIIDQNARDEMTAEPAQDDSTPIELKFHELRISKNAALYTMGQNVHIVVENLIGEEGAMITTFPAKQTAPMGHAGRSGGKLVIEVQHAEGSVLFAMRGEIGGQGLAGMAPDASKKGAEGRVGDAFIGLPEGTCINQNQVNGHDGATGLPGYQGGTGFVGGDSGELELTLPDADDFSYSVRGIPGAGGAGGMGGDGGEGGTGGPPSNSTLKCFHSGKQGAQGPQGPRGNQGSPGIKQAVCVNQNGSEHCQ